MRQPFQATKFAAPAFVLSLLAAGAVTTVTESAAASGALDGNIYYVAPNGSDAAAGTQAALVPEAPERANPDHEAGADCVFPIVLWELDALRPFMADVRGPVNVVRLPQAPPLRRVRRGEGLD